MELIDADSMGSFFLTESPSVRSFLFWVEPELTGSYWQVRYLGKAELRSGREIESEPSSLGEKFGFTEGANRGIN